MSYIVDTNIVMKDIDFTQYDKVYVPVIVLEELDKHNHSSDESKSYKSRNGLRNLRKSETDKGNIVYQCNFNAHIIDSVPSWLDLTVKDNIILLYAIYIQSIDKTAILLTEDLNMYQKAKSLNIKVELLNSKIEDTYKGYIEFKGTEEEFNSYYDNLNLSEWFTNEYLIFTNTENGKSKEMRFNGTEFVSLKLPPSNYIKAKTPLQRCALDLLNNDDITIVSVMGGYGSGKSFLCTQMAMYNVVESYNSKQSKILGVREPRGEGKDIGYLKGSFEDKTGRFFKPVEQQLKGGELELEKLTTRGVLETTIPFYMKGTTYDSTIILVDEAEDLSESQIRLIGTRLGKDSKIYFSGDYAQSLINSSLSNPLVKMCNILKGNPKFGCIYLDEDVRSETSKIFANLFK